MCPACYQDGGSLLHCLSTLTPTSEAVYFCCTGLGVTSTGRYPASCPAKPGLSSSEPFRLFSRDHLAWLRKCYSSTFFSTCKQLFTLPFTYHYPARCFGIQIPKASRMHRESCYRARNEKQLHYTLKQLPPMNSLRIELCGTASLGTGTKYSKNFSSLFASIYSGSLLSIPNSNGSA